MGLDDIPQAFHALLNERILEVEACVAQGQAVLPTVFMGRLAEGELIPLMLNFGDKERRSRSMETARAMARQMAADFAIVVTPERHTVRLGTDPAHPTDLVLESVMVVLETPRRGWILQARLLPSGAAGQSGLDEFVVRDRSLLEATLFGILPQSASDSLH